MTLMPNKYFDQTFYMVRCLPHERARDSHRTRPAHNAAAYSAPHRSFLLVAALPAQDANDGDEPMPTACAPMDVGRAGRSRAGSQPYAARQHGDWRGGMT